MLVKFQLNRMVLNTLNAKLFEKNKQTITNKNKTKQKQKTKQKTAF